jgi:acetyl esterase/lipase
MGGMDEIGVADSGPQRSPADARPTPPARTTAYGPDPAQVYDVRLPPGQATGTTIVVVHGGFWRAAYDRSHAAPQAQAFADAGYPTAVLEYRRTGMPGGGWPGTVQDVTAGIAAVRRDRDLPPTLVLVGHSAGGHLAVWAAGEPWAAELAGVVSLAGVLDLTRGWLQRLGDGAVEAFLGGTPTSVPDRYDKADPTVRARLAPVAIVHGLQDQEVPVGQSRSYLEHTARALAPATLRELPGVGHYELIDPGDPAFDEVLAAVDRLASYPGPHA